jgi:hypothetical protein
MLSEDFGQKLDPYVRGNYDALWEAVRNDPVKDEGLEGSCKLRGFLPEGRVAGSSVHRCPLHPNDRRGMADSARFGFGDLALPDI